MLYNEIRPTKLAEVVGQPQVTEVLAAQEKSGRYSNTYLFVGVRGTGKTTTARILARAMNCTNKDKNGEPCGCCPTCKAIMNGSFKNVVELDAARNRSVEDARRLIEQTQYMAPEGKRKVFIIDEVHMFSTEAFNTLLKTLEDPPESCTFILCTTEEYRVPATIISRCQKFNFGTVDNDTISNLLAETLDARGIAYELSGLILIAIAARGSVRDAISILDKCLSDADEDGITEGLVRSLQGIPQEEEVFGLLSGLAQKNNAAVVSTLQIMEQKGYAPGQIVLNAQEVLADCIRFHSLGVEGIFNVPSYKDSLQKLCQVMNEATAISVMAAFVDAKRDVNDIAPYTSLMARMIFYLSESKRVDELEATLKKAKEQLAETNALLEETRKALEEVRNGGILVKATAESEPELEDEESEESAKEQTGAEDAESSKEEDTFDGNSSEPSQEEEATIDINELFGGCASQGEELPSKSASSEGYAGGADPQQEEGGCSDPEDEGEDFDEFFNW